MPPTMRFGVSLSPGLSSGERPQIRYPGRENYSSTLTDLAEVSFEDGELARMLSAVYAFRSWFAVGW